MKVVEGRLAQKHQALNERAGALRQSVNRAMAAYQSAQEEITSATLRLEQAERQILQTESKTSHCYLDQQQNQHHSGQLRQQRQGKADKRQGIEEQTRELRLEISELRDGGQDLTLKINELTVRQETLIQRVQEELQADLEKAYSNYEPGQEDYQALEAEIGDLKGKISRLGNVNLDAIAEQEQLEVREVFLNTQRDDLTQAQQKLNSLIEQLDDESRTRFMETFEAVRENFQHLFRKLFGGGKADMILDNPDDVLESGIDIIARPPGKEARTVSLLSGGERTMTAVALLLAIFRSKPSPFCILDEVDAALDDANVDRFNQLVREFLADSQFIIITHNKSTMAFADVLYGVTMQEAGVSKRVAVKFEKTHTPGKDDEESEAA